MPLPHPTVAAALLVLAAALAAPADAYPTVAVLSNPVSQADASRGSEFGAHYVKWLEALGLRVVPLLYDAPAAAQQQLLARVNGVLLTGGSLELKRPGDAYVAAAARVLAAAREAARAGGALPVWGTCMGFQLLCVLAAGDPGVLAEGAFDAYDAAMPLGLTEEAAGSALLGDAPPALVWQLRTLNITANLHHDGVTPEAFFGNERLRSFFKVLSTNRDRKGVEFISTVEGRELPVFGVQWHPERPPFVWSDVEASPHCEAAIDAAHWVGRAFARAARQNTNRFPSREEEDAAVVWSQLAPTAEGSTQTFYFPPYAKFNALGMDA
eukprot:m51a1_g10783 putative gamma-glutamyl hydrolase (325) ;mRNA; r:55091-56607